MLAFPRRTTKRASLAALALAAALIALPAPAPAAAAVVCVPTTTIAADCAVAAATPQSAVDAAIASPGADTVRLAAGTFAAPLTATEFDASNPTTIIGAGQGATILTGAPALGAAIVSLSGHLSIADLTISETAGEGSGLVLSQALGHDLTVERSGPSASPLVIVEALSSGQTVFTDATISTTTGTGTPLAVTNATVERSVVSSPIIAGAVVSLSGGRLLTSRVLASTALPGAQPTGVSAGGDSLVASSVITVAAQGAVAATTSGAGNLRVADSTLLSLAAGAARPALVAAGLGSSAGLTASGIAARGFPALGCAGTDSATGAAAMLSISYSVAQSVAVGPCTGSSFSSAGPAVITAGAGLIAADPAFADALAGDVQLTAGSPAIDAGDPTPLAPSDPGTDVYGGPRVVGAGADGSARRDAGAAEAASALTPEVAALPAAPAPFKIGSYVRIVPPLGLVSLKTRGSVRVATRASKPFHILKRAPSRKRALVTATFAAPHTTSIARLYVPTGKKKPQYRRLRGTSRITATGTTMFLQPSGSWNGKTLAAGNYLLRLSPMNGTSKTVTLRVVRR